MEQKSEESRRIGRMLLKLFGNWQLTQPQIQTMLGLDRESHIDLHEYLTGEHFFVDRDKLERASLLFGIHKSLRQLFPKNIELAYQWISQPNRALGKLSPIDIIERHGIRGMYIALGYIERQVSGSGMTFDHDHLKPTTATGTGEVPEFLLENGVDDILQILDIWTFAMNIFSNEEQARSWLLTHTPALGCAPAALLTTPTGRGKVLDALRRIEHGDFGG